MIFFGFVSDSFWFFGIRFKVTNVTNKSYQGYYWTPKIAKNEPKQHNLFFCPKGKKSCGRRPKPSAGARSRPVSGLYLLVCLKVGFNFLHPVFADSLPYMYRQFVVSVSGQPLVVSIHDNCLSLVLTSLECIVTTSNSNLE